MKQVFNYSCSNTSTKETNLMYGVCIHSLNHHMVQYKIIFVIFSPRIFKVLNLIKFSVYEENIFNHHCTLRYKKMDPKAVGKATPE